MRISSRSLTALPLIALLAACSAANADNHNETEVVETAPVESTDTAMSETETPTLNLPAGTYTADLAHSSIIWKISHLGLSNYTARFTDFEATLDIDPNAPEDAMLSVTIDPTSVFTGYPNPEQEDFDAKIGEGAQFLNGEAFPEITFNSTDVTVTGPMTADVTGDLTLLGVTMPLTLDVTLNGSVESNPFSGRPTLGFSATGSLNRTDYGLTYLSGRGIGDTVELVIQAEFATDAPSEE